ncbi:MAG: sensor histidine kinase [Ilumatobacter sp.]
MTLADHDPAVRRHLPWSAGDRGVRWPALTDVALATCLAAISLLVAVQAADRGEPGAEAPTAWWQWLVIVLPSFAVAFRRSAPLAATPVAVVGQMLNWGLDLAAVFVAPLVLIYSVAALEGNQGRRVGWAAAAALSAMSGVGVAAAPDVGVDVFALTVLASSAALLLGTNTATQIRESGELAAQLATAEQEQEAARARAVVRERERIAQELHDLVGHSLTVIAVRAEAAERVGATQPSALWDAIAAVGETARGSLADVRRVLHAVHDSTDVALAPSPTIGDLSALVNRVASSGVAVELRLDELDDHQRIDASIAAGVYRIVQEALTNVIKHAGSGAQAFVDVSIDDDELRVAVVDNGRGPVGIDATTGLGMAGMAERVEFLGGTFDAGPSSGGGFRVRASIPLAGTTA